jgi:L,D-transpeptidase YbiS
MKKIVFFVVLPLLLIIVALSVYVLKGGRDIDTQEAFSVPIDSVLHELPTDSKLAKKEVQKVKKALSALKPAKPYIVIDTHANRIFLRIEDSILLEATCSAGSGGEFIDSTTGRKWVFNTPRGIFKVDSKIPHPWWRKPDWAFLEEGEQIPNDDGERLDPNMMGDFALGFGDGFFIHGTIYERLLGVSVTHGCVRVGSDDLEVLYNKTPMGTYVYIF